MFLQCADPSWTQCSPISKAQAGAALEAVARLHAAAWEDVDLLQKAALRLQRSLFSSPPSPPPPLSLLLSGCLFVGWEERR